MDRRFFLLGALGAPLLTSPALAAGQRMEVFKTPTCGCCTAWIAHIEQAGIAVDARDVDQQELWGRKVRAGIPAELSSCHTGFIEGYFVEGHVPAADVHRLLEERPDALGLTVPGMPIGSPGMEMGDHRDAFETLLIGRGGEVITFQRHG
ncbi:MAG: DUF411 domain-containing protein [Rhodobacteraceae bacterium]|nr:DUF411 domain-containing protein [Paracoccaceae bacterium]